jgi:hypothetical protein
MAAGCSGAETVPADAGLDAGGGTPVEGCIDIHVDRSIMPDPLNWSSVDQYARHPLWRDPSGFHVFWINGPPDVNRMYLLVSNFDPESGNSLGTQVYDVFPPGLGFGAVGIWDAVGNAAGSFAAAVYFDDGSDSYGAVDRVVLGTLADVGATVVWTPPWSRAEYAVFHVGWDGEAFAVHAVSQSTPEVRLLRLLPDGTELGSVDYVGTITNIFYGESTAATDPVSGTTWFASNGDEGLWLSGHHRDGSLLEGTEAQGGFGLEGQGVATPAGFSVLPGLGTAGTRAVVGWIAYGHYPDEVRVQLLEGAATIADAVLRFYETWHPADRVIAHHDGGWWMGQRSGSQGILSCWLDEHGGDAMQPSTLVPFESCTVQTCAPGQPQGFDARAFSAAGYQDEVWLGFWDLSDQSLPLAQYPTALSPYRLLRVKPGCVYQPNYVLAKAEAGDAGP